MTIINNSKDIYSQQRKGFHYGKTSVIDQIASGFGHALTARSTESRSVECLLRVLTYNLMIVYLLLKKSYILVFSTEQN